MARCRAAQGGARQRRALCWVVLVKAGRRKPAKCVIIGDAGQSRAVQGGAGTNENDAGRCEAGDESQRLPSS
jgi:hypothetical protein